MSRESLMDEVRSEVEACRRCGLWRRRRNPVPGEGSLNAAVMFIGEAPGYWEDVRGRPFVGAAGKLLDEMLEGIGLSRGDVYIGNVLKCRPPGNRDPRPDEVLACAPHLERQIEIIRPRAIVTMGRHSTSQILSKAGFEARGITGARGRVYEGQVLGLEVRIIPAYHPAAALYNPKYRNALESDFQIVRRELEKLGGNLYSS